MSKIHDLYYAASYADRDYHEALVAEYGGSAGDMRYQTAKQPAHIRRLGEIKVAADEAYLAACREQRPWIF